LILIYKCSPFSSLMGVRGLGILPTGLLEIQGQNRMALALFVEDKNGGHTFKEMGDKFGLSSETVRIIFWEPLDKLKDLSEIQALKEDVSS
jgi:DNA-directed RNA polymerase sigma subunit (sigma70/sigma32)